MILWMDINHFSFGELAAVSFYFYTFYPLWVLEVKQQMDRQRIVKHNNWCSMNNISILNSEAWKMFELAPAVVDIFNNEPAREF
jgi:hypothetical protein